MHGSEGTSMMTPQTPQNLKATQAPTSSSTFTIEEEQPSSTSKAPGISPPTTKDSSLLAGGVPAPLTEGIDSQFTEDLFPEEGTFITSSDALEAPLSSPTQPSSQQEPSKAEKKEPSTSSTSPQRVKKKTQEDTSLLGKKAPSAAHQLKQKKETPAAPIKLQRQAAPTKPKPAEVSSQTPKSSPPPKTFAKPQPQKPVEKPFQPPRENPPATTPPSLPQALPPMGKDKLHEKTPSEGRVLAQEMTKQATRTQSDTTSQDHSKSKDDKKEAEAIAASAASVTPIAPFHIPETSQAAPAYATLSPDVYEIFEKMVGVMTIEMTKGVTTTTVIINKKDSIFNGAKIILDHYSTAPNAFNVTIAASPEAQEVINTNLASLAAAFEQSKLSFQVNLRRPILLEEHQAISRKRKAGEEEEEGERKKKK